MTINTEKLLVLKAFYMGHAVAEKKHNAPVAIDMIDTAVRKLEKSTDEKNKIRLLFYVLLKSEILRETPDVIGLRAQAKETAESIGGNVFDYYMAVEEATQTISKAYGIQKGVIENKGVQTTESYTVSDGFNVWVVSYDAACRALDVNEHRLSEQETNFLHHISLKEMLKKQPRQKNSWVVFGTGKAQSA
ncbi:MAG: hypothetical protein RPU59_04155 [Candidatus Sedimenticola sp. (ex Thyasira tokunagai)]